MSTVHTVAEQGFGIGNEHYDRARPSYQENAIAHIRKSVAASGPLNVVEIGAGTGLFTRALLTHPDWAGSLAELRAVEPSAGMREVFSKTVTDPRASVRDGTFDTTGVEDSWADVVILAQAFHWCPDYDKACAEFARVLKPGGVVAFIWNLEDRNRATWVAQLRDLYERHEKGSPQFRLGLWRATFSTPTYGKFFEPQEENVWNYILPGSRDIVVDRACSKSYIAVLPPDERHKLLDDIDALMKKRELFTWVDETKGVFEYPYQTFLIISKMK